VNNVTDGVSLILQIEWGCFVWSTKCSQLYKSFEKFEGC